MYSPSSADSPSSTDLSSVDFNMDAPALGQSSNIEMDEKRTKAKTYQPSPVLMSARVTQPKSYDSVISLTSNSSLSDVTYQKNLEPRFDLPGPSYGPKMSADEFRLMVDFVRDGIKNGVEPERISAGSSGSYYAKNRYGEVLGVFKPKDEEPYSQMNPKWSKWLHRTCCPCCFGRSCIMVSEGYLSEAAASIVDRFLGLDLVPRTEIVALGASSFHYSLADRWSGYQRSKCDLEKLGDDRPYTSYREKIGSFQIFVKGFKDAKAHFDEIKDLHVISKDVEAAFQEQFEKLVILDYTIRNTDRSLDNLLVRFDWYEDPELGDGKFKPLRPVVNLAAIDNGLAFPYKHPDNWRTYPFGWATLPNVHIPFSQTLSRQMLGLLHDRDRWDVLVEQLRDVFRLDVQFRERHFQRQMSVLRGQLRNIVECLSVAGKTPLDLISMEPILIQEEEMYLRDLKKAEKAISRAARHVKGELDVEDSTEGHPRWKRTELPKPYLSNF